MSVYLQASYYRPNIAQSQFKTLLTCGFVCITNKSVHYYRLSPLL